MPITLENQFAYAFSPVVLERGREVFRRQQVQSLSCEAFADGSWVLIGQVVGTSVDPYDTEVLLDPGRHGRLKVSSSCSCPVGAHCKHAAALLFAQLARNTQQGGNAGSMQENQALGIWMLQVQNLMRERQQGDRRLGEGSQKPYFPEVLLFSLQPTRTFSRRFRLVGQRGRWKNSGELGKLSHYSFPSLALGTQPAYVQDADLPVLMLVQRMSGGLYSPEPELTGHLGSQLLRALMQTGRCYWAGPDGRPLVQGEPLAAQVFWEADVDGRQRPRLTDEPGVILPIAPPWLLDEHTGVCRELRLPEGDDVAELVALAPPLSGEALLQQVEALARLAPSLPRPSAGLPPLLEDVPPQPVLRLSALQTFGRDTAFTIDGRVRLGLVMFDYAGTRISAQAPEPLLTARPNGKPAQIRRQPAAEAAWLAQLPETAQPAGLAVSWLNAQGWPAGTWSFADQNEWLSFLGAGQGAGLERSESDPESLPVSGVAALEAAGWRVEGQADVSFDLQDIDDLELEIHEKSGTDWFDVGVDFRDGPKRINLLPLIREHADRIAQLKDGEHLLLPVPGQRNRVYRMPGTRARLILSTLTELIDRPTDASGKLRLSRLQAFRLLDLPTREWRGGKALRDAAEALRLTGGLPPVALPDSFHGTLRPYQQTGVDWLQFGRTHGLSGILADDMGLGKTVQTLAHLAVEKHAGRMGSPSLLVVPTSLLANWRHEAERFAPDLRILILHGQRRAQQFERVQYSDLVISTYPLMARDRSFWKEQDLHYLILDEAQAIKNARSQAATTLRALKARHRLCLTGTPMENHLGELWSLMDFLNPGVLGDEKQFGRIFRKPIEQHGDNERRQSLQRRVAPFLLRRKKEDVAKELPPKIEILRSLSLDGKQRDLYESLRVAMQDRLRDEIARKGFNQSQIVILDALLKLRQVCCDPRLVKLATARSVKESAKLDYLRDLIPTLLDEGRRILLFSQFTEMLALIETDLNEAGIPFVKLTGDTRDRETPVNQFQNLEVPLFLISLKAGGVGLNLTAADTVIHYDPWWNPAAENQATDRAHRIGQDKTVFVYKLVTEGTVEEKILALQDKKKDLAQGVYGEQKTGDSSFSAEDLAALFEPLPE